MDKEEIEDLLISLEESDYYTVLKYAGIEIDREPDSIIDDQNEKVLKKLMNNIEKGDYNYFISRRYHEKEEIFFIDLLKYASKKEDIKYVIERKKDIVLDALELKTLLLATEDKKYIKKFINKQKEKLYLEDKTEDGKVTKNPIIIIELIEELADFNYTKSFLENFERLKEYKFTAKDIQKLISSTGNLNYIKEIVNNSKKVKKYGLNSLNIIELVKNTKNTQYIKSFIEDDNNIKKYNMNSSDKKKLIESTGDFEYIKSIIEDDEKSKELEINFYDRVKLVFATNNKRYIENELKNLEKDKSDPNKKVNLPEDMTLGIEIETEGRLSEVILGLQNKIYEDWKCEKDGSLNSGVEIISPILKGNEDKTTESIKKVCARLSGLKQEISSRCGGHVHIGADYLKSPESLNVLTDIWTNFEEILYLISNEKEELPRKKAFTYAMPISKKIEEKINDWTLSLDTKTDLEKILKDIQKESKNFGINFRNFGYKEKNTIEFRVPNGTINANTWIENINLFGYIVKASQEIAEIQIKKEQKAQNLKEEELNKFKLLEKIRNEKLNNKEKLQILMELVIPEDERKIYIERYMVNNELLENELEIKESILNKITINPINVSKEDIKMRIFKNKEEILLEEFEEISTDIQKDLEIQNSEKLLN